MKLTDIIHDRLNDYRGRLMDNPEAALPDLVIRLHPKDMMICYTEYPPYRFTFERKFPYGGFFWELLYDLNEKPRLEYDADKGPIM